MTGWRELVAAIATDSRSGATALTLLAVEALVAAEAAGEVLPAARAVVQAQPAMASLLNLAGEALAAAEAGQSAGAVARAFAARLEETSAGVTRRAAELIPPGGIVLTVSSSSAVRSAVLAAHQSGRRLRLLCLESRPALEGRELAYELAEAGLEVELAVDAAAARLAARCDLVLVGGDAVLPAGLVNKLGTLGLALAARHARRPIFALCGLEKFSAGLVNGALQRGGPGSELVDRPPPARLVAFNPYFELTELELLSGVVTEQGLVDVGTARSLAESRVPHPALADLVSAG